MIVPNAACRGPYLRRARLVLASLASAALVLATSAVQASVTRFPLRDRAPFNAIIGVGDSWPDARTPFIELSWDIASHATSQHAGHETLLLDGETHALTLRVQRTLGPRLTLGLELPWVAHGGGFMDRVIDEWHDTFGFSEGIRPNLPTGDLRFSYARDGVEVFRMDDATSGIADVRTAASWRLSDGARGRPAFDLVAAIEWPTGSADRLTGSGGTDATLGLRLASPEESMRAIAWSLGAGITWPGDVDLPLPEPAGQVRHYDAALAWRAWPAIELVLQAAGHSGGWRSGLETLGASALQFGGGIVWRIAPRWQARIGVFEDVRPDTTPDFASEITLRFGPAAR